VGVLTQGFKQTDFLKSPSKVEASLEINGLRADNDDDSA
jgi:hypothetical protein